MRRLLVIAGAAVLVLVLTIGAYAAGANAAAAAYVPPDGKHHACVAFAAQGAIKNWYYLDRTNPAPVCPYGWTEIDWVDD